MLQVVNRSLSGLGQSYRPPGNGPFPTVMVLHGSEGAWSGYSYLTAAILAAHGFLAVPFGYSVGGDVWNAGDIRDVALDRTAEALAVLHALPLSGKVGLYGVIKPQPGSGSACPAPAAGRIGFARRDSSRPSRRAAITHRTGSRRRPT